MQACRAFRPALRHGRGVQVYGVAYALHCNHQRHPGPAGSLVRHAVTMVAEQGGRVVLCVLACRHTRA